MTTRCRILAVRGKHGLMGGYANLTKPVESIFVKKNAIDAPKCSVF